MFLLYIFGYLSLKNWKGSESLSYLEANNLASFMGVGRSHDTPRSETKDSLLLMALAVARVSAFVSVPWASTLAGHCEENRVMPTHAMMSIIGEEPWV